MTFTRRVAAALMLVAVLGSAALARAQGIELAPKKGKEGSKVTIDWVKSYLVEVKNHLKKSYINGKDLTDKDLVAACLRGFQNTIADETGLDKTARKALLAFLRDGDWKKVTELVVDLGKYLDENGLEVDLEKVADAGAKEMVAFTRDPYSHIFNAEEIQKLMKTMMGEARDESLGLSVHPDETGKLTVAYVMYGYVAYESGIEINDEVLGINGKPVKGMSLLEVNQALQAKAGEQVRLKISREGWLKPHEFTLVQKVNKARDVIWKVLPGQIGYLRMTIFDMGLGTQVKLALDRMAGKGMRGIILDLRHNPGGALNAAVEVADEFVKGKQLITKTESDYKLNLPIKLPGLPEMAGDFWSGKKSPYEDCPMIVLVDHASASASELLTGALQDLKRAKLIGETTYGKGVGQTAIPLWKTGFPMPQRYLYLTVMKYYLPSGRSIHGSGVVPDRAVARNRPTPEKFEQLWALRESGAISDYIAAHWEQDRKALEKLAAYDAFDCAAYPGFEEWYRGLKSGLTRDEARGALREGLRGKAQDVGKFSYACDLQEDNQLQEAVLEMAETLGVEPKAEAR